MNLVHYGRIQIQVIIQVQASQFVFYFLFDNLSFRDL